MHRSDERPRPSGAARARLVTTVLSVAVVLTALVSAHAGVEMIEVAPLAVPCAPGDGDVACLMVRSADGGPWRVSSDAIEGFERRAGHGYRLLLGAVSEGRRALLAVLEERPLGDVRWRIERVDRGGDALELADHGDAWLRLDVSAGRLYGSSGCNSFFGPAHDVAPGRLAVGALAGTLMACPEPTMQGERALLAVLEGVVEYHEVGGSLLLEGSAGAAWLRPELPREATAAVRTWGDPELVRFDESAAAALAAGERWPLDPLQVAQASEPPWDAPRLDLTRRDTEPEEARFSVVRIEAGGFLDDSVAGFRRVVALERRDDGRWRVIAESHAVRCARGDALWIAATELCP